MGVYSLIQVCSQNGGSFTGVWVEDFTGDINDAHRHARGTEAANGNKIRIAVVDKTNSATPNYSLHKFDIRRAYHV